MTYREMIERIARLRGKRRLIVEVPVLTPFLSSLWLHLVTPVGASVARPLVEGLRNPTVAQDERIRELVPIRLTPSTRRRATHYASSKRFPDVGPGRRGPSGVSSGSRPVSATRRGRPRRGLRVRQDDGGPAKRRRALRRRRCARAFAQVLAPT